MLVSITNKCRMGCIHCMDDAKSDNNEFMDYDTFIHTLDFTFKIDRVMVLTGGEPTEHPDFWKYLAIAADYISDDNALMVVTNGMNMDNDTGVLKKGLETICKNSKGIIMFQVTSDDRFYPQKINLDNPIFKSEYVKVDTVPLIYPVGRALTNNLEYSDKYLCPHCFNVRSITRSKGSLKEAIDVLRPLGKMCSPQIAFDGSIKLGESSLCPPVAHINDSLDVIDEKIKNFRCRKCEIGYNKLSSVAKYAIGEITEKEYFDIEFNKLKGELKV